MPFCKQCGAPQIRVPGMEATTTAEPKADSSESLPPPPLSGSATLPSPPGRPRVTDFPSPPPPPPARAGVLWSRALPSAALAGVFSLLAMVIPYAIFGPAFMMGGALAVMLYRRHLGGTAPPPGVGAKIGAASGGFGFLFSAVMAIATLVYRPAEVRQDMLNNLSQMVGRGYDPKKVALVQDLVRTPDGLAFFVGFGLLVMLVVMVAGSSIGGALYAAWVRKRPAR
jgi:hypothetical protein